MNVSGTATVTTDATFQIFGSDAATSAAININGGNYDVGGTFFAFIDGNGTIAFNNASVHADVLKVGAFGTNGVLNIGGGTLSADTTLKLYASGSNGQLNFISNVTLGGNSAKILAANSITIFDNVVVTVGNIGDEIRPMFSPINANYSEHPAATTRLPARLLARARIIRNRSIRRRHLVRVLPRLRLLASTGCGSSA